MVDELKDNIVFGFLPKEYFGGNKVFEITNDEFSSCWCGKKEHFIKLFDRMSFLMIQIHTIIKGPLNYGENIIKICLMNKETKKCKPFKLDNDLNITFSSSAIFLNSDYVKDNLPPERDPTQGWCIFDIHLKGLLYLISNSNNGKFTKASIKELVTKLSPGSVAIFILFCNYIGVVWE